MHANFNRKSLSRVQSFFFWINPWYFYTLRLSSYIPGNRNTDDIIPFTHSYDCVDFCYFEVKLNLCGRANYVRGEGRGGVFRFLRSHFMTRSHCVSIGTNTLHLVDLDQHYHHQHTPAKACLSFPLFWERWSFCQAVNVCVQGRQIKRARKKKSFQISYFEFVA